MKKVYLTVRSKQFQCCQSAGYTCVCVLEIISTVVVLNTTTFLKTSDTSPPAHLAPSHKNG